MRTKWAVVLCVFCLLVGFLVGRGGDRAGRVRDPGAAPDQIIINEPTGNPTEPRKWRTLAVYDSQQEPDGLGPDAVFVRFVTAGETTRVYRCRPR